MEQPSQCPFIDRVDHRCPSYFSLERLDHAFDVCFDRYKSCPLFRELMAERRMRRALGDAATDGGRHVPQDAPALWVAANGSRASHAASRFVQIRVSRATRAGASPRRAADAHAMSAAGASRVSVAPGV